jgi:hypothetical protein
MKGWIEEISKAIPRAATDFCRFGRFCRKARGSLRGPNHRHDASADRRGQRFPPLNDMGQFRRFLLEKRQAGRQVN